SARPPPDDRPAPGWGLLQPSEERSEPWRAAGPGLPPCGSEPQWPPGARRARHGSAPRDSDDRPDSPPRGQTGSPPRGSEPRGRRDPAWSSPGSGRPAAAPPSPSPAHLGNPTRRGSVAILLGLLGDASCTWRGVGPAALGPGAAPGFGRRPPPLD